MSSEFSGENLEKLMRACKNDHDYLDEILSCLWSFEDYHQAIYRMETKTRLFNVQNMDRSDYQDMFDTLNSKRTTCHNLVIANVQMLNDLAEKLGIEPIYSGAVSKDTPYRTILADAVLAYAERVVTERPRAK